MAFRTIHKVTSLKYPQKTYTSADSFWADHEEEDAEITDIINVMLSDGRLLEDNDELSDDGMSVIYTKTFNSYEDYETYMNDNTNVISDNAINVYNFEVIFKGEVDI